MAIVLRSFGNKQGNWHCLCLTVLKEEAINAIINKNQNSGEANRTINFYFFTRSN